MQYVAVLGRLVLSVVLWCAYLIPHALLWLAGIPICYALSKRAMWVYRESKYFGNYIHAWRPRWAWLWGNEEDGVTGPDWWAEQNADKPIERRAFIWSALRNPVNNLRFVPVIHPVIDPSRIRFIGNDDDPPYGTGEKRLQWAFTWQGIFSGFALRWQATAKRHFSVRVGWKLLPRDRFGLEDSDYRKVRCPFGVQVHLWRKSA